MKIIQIIKNIILTRMLYNANMHSIRNVNEAILKNKKMFFTYKFFKNSVLFYVIIMI